ncbi:MAG: undecaprenyl-diphosphatase UppP [Deltaproteobacteria bacterium]|nr:undecaprenyl-diphosphatase UppP [Deltaproteobacteria bacterium]
MESFYSILLAVIQGLGEFLPISSSAHLVILPWFMEFKDPGLAFDVALHAGTLISLLIYFRKDWWEILRHLPKVFQKKSEETEQSNYYRRLPFLLVLSTIPAGIAGVLLEKYIESVLRSPWIVASTMAVFGILLHLSDRLSLESRSIEKVTWKEALLIGIAQTLALIPGSSRSGVTITAGRLLKLDRHSAARFSFLMSTPVIAGATILKFKDFFTQDFGYNVILGIGVSAFVGFLAIKYMLRLLKTYSFLPYVLYRLAFAAVVILKLLLTST